MAVQPKIFEQWQEPPQEGELRLVPIGGLGDFGMNALVVHTAKTLLLVDCGQLFPTDEQPGIDSIVPDFAYFEPFADSIDAVLLTHGHEDHIGALPYFIERWPVPVYGTPFTLELVANRLKEHELKTKLIEVHDFTRLAIGCGEIESEWVPVTHSIPDACAIVLHTGQGVIFHSGDFKFDQNPVDGRKTGTGRIEKLGSAGVRALLSDSTNIHAPGRAPSESQCKDGLAKAFDATKGRLYLATFSSHIHRVQAVLDLATKTQRRVCVVGRSLERNIAVARNLGLLTCHDDIFIDAKDLQSYEPSNTVVLCTGSQAEPLSGLVRILKGEVKGVVPVPGDRLVLSARSIPGNEVPISKMLDKAARLGMETYIDGFEPVHVTGHAHKEDVAQLMDMLKPEYVIPAHGTYRLLQGHARLAQSKGWTAEKTPILDGGQCLQLFSDGTSRQPGVVPIGKSFVNEGLERPVDARIVHDRLIMQEDGIIVATIQMSKQCQIVGEPGILSRGFVILNDDETYSGLLKATIRKAFDEAPPEAQRDKDLLSELLRQSLKRVIRKTTQTRPMIVVMVLDIKNG
jgi:ribonuclease J